MSTKGQLESFYLLVKMCLCMRVVSPGMLLFVQGYSSFYNLKVSIESVTVQ